MTMPPLPNFTYGKGQPFTHCPSKWFTTNPNPNETMNAEQLARDIKSLPEAHKTLDEAGIPYADNIGARVKDAARHKSINSDMNFQAHQELKRAGLGSRGMLPDCAKAVVDELLKLREARDPYLMEVIKQAHKQMSRVEPEGNGDISQRAARLADELLKLREENKQVIAIECSRKTHEHLSRLGKNNPPYSRLDVRVGALVDELLKLRAQGEVNSSNLSDVDRHYMRAQMIAALNQSDIGNATPTVDMVDRLISCYKDLQHVANQKEMWRAFPVGGGRSRVMRGTEDATPHLVSEHVAQAICDDLNKQGV